MRSKQTVANIFTTKTIILYCISALFYEGAVITTTEDASKLITGILHPAALMEKVANIDVGVTELSKTTRLSFRSTE